MIIGDRLRALREEKGLSQGDIENRTGLLRCYISRVENGHTVPNIETLEKIAAAFEIPLYEVLYEGRPSAESKEVTSSRPSKDDRFLRELRRLTTRMDQSDRRLFLDIARNLAKR